ncbi:MAG: Hpt domain-containing protein, partial [Gallionella sp.]|nr:Hpt domain-containing protein [Gallionella sp.]
MEKIIQATLTRLRDEFIGRLPGRVAALEPLLDAVSKGEQEAVEQLNREAHSLVGVSGTYRLMQVFEAARKLEGIVSALPKNRKPSEAELHEMREALANLVDLSKKPSHNAVPFAEKQQASQRIVVVDDDVEQSNWMRSILEQAGFQVEVFNELSIFRNACQSHQEMPAAVIMDMMFPEGDAAGARTVEE